MKREGGKPCSRYKLEFPVEIMMSTLSLQASTSVAVLLVTGITVSMPKI